MTARSNKLAAARDAKRKTEKFNAFADDMRSQFEKHLDGIKAYYNENLYSGPNRQSRWNQPMPAERDMPRFDREQAMTQARQMVDTNPLAAGIVLNATDQVVSTGFNLRMCVPKNKAWNEDVEGRYNAQKDNFDIRGMRSKGELDRCKYARRYIDGDIIVKRESIVGKKGTKPDLDWQFKLNLIEAEMLRKEKFDWLDQGIVWSDDGCKRPVGFWVGDVPKDQIDYATIFKSGNFVKSEDACLYAHLQGERVNQMRGVSVFIQSFNLMQDVFEIIKAVVQKSKNEAFIALAFMMDGGVDGKIFGSLEDVKTGADGKTRRNVPLTPGLNLHLKPGEKVDMLGMKTPNSEFIPFIRFLLRILGMPFGLPLELMLMDVSETNFSGGRMLVELARQRHRVEQKGLCRVNDRELRWWFENEVQHHGLKLPKGITTNDAALIHQWDCPRLPYYDPKKELDVKIEAMAHHIESPQDVIREMTGKDPDEVLAKIIEWAGMLKAAQLPEIYGQVSTTIKTGESATGQLIPGTSGK
jgi:capsid protein